jgi:hypothetical protein
MTHDSLAESSVKSSLMGHPGRERKACIVISIITASLVSVLLLVAAIGLAARRH